MKYMWLSDWLEGIDFKIPSPSHKNSVADDNEFFFDSFCVSHIFEHRFQIRSRTRDHSKKV